jgi:hypothetical protein
VNIFKHYIFFCTCFTMFETKRDVHSLLLDGVVGGWGGCCGIHAGLLQMD